MLTVVGIDPSKLTGLAVVRRTEDRRLRVLNIRTLEIPDTWSAAPGSAIRIFQEAVALAEFAEGRVAVAIEMPFFAGTEHRGAFGAQMMLVGGLLSLLAAQQVDVRQVNVKSAKMAATGDPNATKAAVITAVKDLPGVATALDWKRKPYREAQADAVSVAMAGIEAVIKEARNARP